ncbi:alpha/beta hydrolase [Deminuibacter soli]|uniref:Alpha/beta hydrolase n=1 Tax=Deminuibacter soli TaxID=2291815 RepID=A0A3E1NLJ0_9BACT|nr:alpha/beta hydrolase [Deminuibacter soli]RFM28658.1 alpha/beta hydrolase [Deminuibacter soli]
MKKALFTIATIAMYFTAQAQQVIPLYSGTVPNSKPSQMQEHHDTTGTGAIRGIQKVTTPALTVYLPVSTENTGTAVIICPGGGYHGLAVGHEGYDVAQLLSSWGITAFVLKYRLPDDAIMENKTIGPLQDAQRALQLVRERAAEWKIDVNKVGIMGFSAGGHLASTAGTHFNMPVIENKANVNLRPDFMILCYPVISFADSICHKGSRDNLLGFNAKPDKVKLYSNETQVTAQTPPVFIFHAEDDNVVPVQNTLYFYEALLHKHVPSEMHIYPKGGHGFGLRNPTTTDEWAGRLHNWMKANKWIW